MASSIVATLVHSGCNIGYTRARSSSSSPPPPRWADEKEEDAFFEDAVETAELDKFSER